VEQLRLANEAEQVRRSEEAALVERLRLDAEAAELAIQSQQVASDAEKAAEAVRQEQNRLLRLRELAAAKLLESQRLEQVARSASQSNVASIEAATLIDANQNVDVAPSNDSSLDQSPAQITARQADKIRLDALEEAAREEARRQITAADRLATDRQIAEERAAAERRASRAARLQRAKEIEVQNAAAKAALTALASDGQSAARASTPQSTNIQASAPSVNTNGASQTRSTTNTSPISDDELQTVYKRFSILQGAISNRDISAVVGLTERSGLRVQQFMQMFENSVGIDVRIRNVSTSNATGEINGILQIKSIERSDGTLVSPPANLQSIKVTTKRQGDGWSVIRW
jgi:hypothetical protein